MTDIKVRSHVARDLLQSAGMFKNERLAVWEYVSNSLQYLDPKISPVVDIRIDSHANKITIADNGRGMDWDGLSNYFIMHGENIDRKAGRPGRGFFGTGKSAAFGIGDILRITTTRNHKTSSVELTRKSLEHAESGDPVPVKTIYQDKPNQKNNGTLIEIENIRLRTIDQKSIIEYIERQIAKYPKDSTVMVNNHRCEYVEPSIDRELTYRTSGEYSDVLGDCELTIKVSRSPLDKDLRGISVYSNGVWHETTSLGAESKEMSDFIFGEIDVPALDEDKSVPTPFDASRSMRLNPNNIIVSSIYSFVSPHLENVRKQLAEEHKKEKATEDARKLAEEASKIEKIINSDFDSFRNKIKKAQSAISEGGLDDSEGNHGDGDDGQENFIFGGDDSADIINDNQDIGKNEDGMGSGLGEPMRLNPTVVQNDEGESSGHHERKTPAKRPRGGFMIDFIYAGQSSARADYNSDKRTIFINLDHPQIAAARQDRPPEDPVFRRLTYEVAFTEYAIALASELYNLGGYYNDPYDPIYDIRDSINRVALEASQLYL